MSYSPLEPEACYKVAKIHSIRGDHDKAMAFVEQGIGVGDEATKEYKNLLSLKYNLLRGKNRPVTQLKILAKLHDLSGKASEKVSYKIKALKCCRR